MAAAPRRQQAALAYYDGILAPLWLMGMSGRPDQTRPDGSYTGSGLLEIPSRPVGHTHGTLAVVRHLTPLCHTSACERNDKQDYLLMVFIITCHNDHLTS